ncbi:MAG: spondin domain-containing protein [Planctomycetota bacterium]
MHRSIRSLAVACAGVAGLAVFNLSSANAQAVGDIQIDIAHGNQTDLSLTPVWFGFHNGAFDMFDVGSPADAVLGTNAVELVAELGDVSQITADFTAAPGIPGDIQGVVTAVGTGSLAAPPIQPGETGTGFVTPINPSGYQYFSFLSMIVPTNDTFIGNDDPLAYRVFNDDDQLIDAMGNPTLERVITLTAADVLDAATEVNNGIGAAFTQGQDGTLGTDENGNVTLGSDLSAFLGVTDVTGRTINDLITGDEVLATITLSIVPEPATASLLGLGALAVVRRKRRNA